MSLLSLLPRPAWYQAGQTTPKPGFHGHTGTTPPTPSTRAPAWESSQWLQVTNTFLQYSSFLVAKPASSFPMSLVHLPKELLSSQVRCTLLLPGVERWAPLGLHKVPPWVSCRTQLWASYTLRAAICSPGSSLTAETRRALWEAPVVAARSQSFEKEMTEVG